MHHFSVFYFLLWYLIASFDIKYLVVFIYVSINIWWDFGLILVNDMQTPPPLKNDHIVFLVQKDMVD